MKIMHISDLHISKEMHYLAESTHSLELLKGIQSICQDEKPDYVFVTGDITDLGDGQSLVNAREWLFNTIPIGGDDRIGLELQPKNVFLIPGNHDAYNITTPKSPLLLRQESLENFFREFDSSSYQTIDQENFGCRYFWLNHTGTPIFLCLVDSSYLGDPSERTSGVGNLDRIACGKWLRQQARTILSWYDQGIAGTLPFLNTEDRISESDFRRSTKVLLMHHYLFEPKEGSRQLRDYFLRIKNKKEIIGNVLMADFDLLLCGHKHVLSADDRTYAQHLDPRSTNRILLNAFKRQLGLRTSPMETDHRGRRIKRALLNCIHIIASWLHGKEKDGIIDLVERHLNDVAQFEQRMKEIFTDTDPAFEKLNAEEADGIITAIQKLNPSQRIELSRIATKQLRECSKAFGKRKFLHIMSGSSAKKTSIPYSRALNIYEILDENKGVKIRFKRYTYGPEDSSNIDKSAWSFKVNEDGGERIFHLSHSRRGRS